VLVRDEHLAGAGLRSQRQRRHLHSSIHERSGTQDTGTAGLRFEGHHTGSQAQKDLGAVADVGAHVEHQLARRQKLSIEGQVLFVFRAPTKNSPQGRGPENQWVGHRAHFPELRGERRGPQAGANARRQRFA